jgi:indolepyruvate ferredoxin oxidoreductase alpha subunit
VVHNPGRWDRFAERQRRKVIGWLQGWRERRRLSFADA